MFLFGLSGSLIPYFLFTGFMLISFLEGKHEEDSGVVDSRGEQSVLVCLETVCEGNSQKDSSLLYKCERTDVTVNKLSVNYSEPYSPWFNCLVIWSGSTVFYHFLLKENLVGLSPPSTRLLHFQVCY